MARLENVITSIYDIFKEYAEGEGKKDQLSKAELKALLEKEIQSPELKDKISPEDINEAMEILDKNHDGEVSFKEFCRCVCVLSKCYYQFKKGKGSKEGKSKDNHEEV